uniref:DNA-directed RNA polymerase III subunit RPC3 n=1 Tax=Steinernema glaseri TaxID=37863 RepID=A0A1I7Z0T5_9BILA
MPESCLDSLYFSFPGIFMSSAIVELCAVTIEERFGNGPLAVVRALSKGPLPLPLIVKQLVPNIKLSKIKRSLATLVHFDYVSFTCDGARTVYKLNTATILNCLKVPRVCSNVFGSYGPSADALFREFVMFGKQPYSRAVREASKGAVDEVANIQSIFHSFVDTHLLYRCPAVAYDAYDCPYFEENYERYTIPALLFEDELEERQEKAPDADILWSIDWTRVDRILRDYFVAEAVVLCNIVDPVCEATALAFIKLRQARAEVGALTSWPTATIDIVRATKDNNPGLEKHAVERALRTLHEDSQGIIRRTGESMGGLYVLDYKKAITLMIFKLLQQKGFLEEEQIEKLVMMPKKDTRQLTYALVDAGFVNIRHISKTNDFAPATTYCLFHVNMFSVVSSMLNTTAKSIHNIIVRRLHEEKRYASLLDQKLKLDEVLRKIAESENLSDEEKAQQEEDVRDTYMNNEDRAFLEKYEGAVKKASLTEVLQADTFMMFEQYLTFATLRC